MTTPIENLRNEHRHCSCWGENCSVKRNPQEDWNSHCFKCAVTWPCDTIAALDALEEDVVKARSEAWKELRDRLDTATVLIRQAMKERHDRLRTISGQWAPERRCGASIGTSIDTCPNCAPPYRAWLAGDKEAGNE